MPRTFNPDDAWTMTPEWARALLDANTANRAVKPTNLEKIRRAMTTEGMWMVNGESIKIASTGRVLDGQHRLLVCAETETPFKTFIVEGLDESVWPTIDTGAPRTAGDALHVEGHAAPRDLAALGVRLYLASLYGIEGAVGKRARPTIAETRQFVIDTPGLGVIVSDARRVRRAVPVPLAVLGLLIYTFQQIDKEQSDWFFERLVDGAGMEVGDPILALRNHLIQAKPRNSVGLSDRYSAAVVIKAWNKCRAGETVTTLRFKMDGDGAEAFPLPK